MTDHPLAKLVVPLVWTMFDDGLQYEAVTAFPGISYYIDFYENGTYGWFTDFVTERGYSGCQERGLTLEAAKAAAEADYERRILSALSAPTDVTRVADSQPAEFDIGELFDVMEWNGDRYVPEDLYSDAVDRLVVLERENEALIAAGMSCCNGTPNPTLPRAELAISFIQGSRDAGRAADALWREYKSRAEAADSLQADALECADRFFEAFRARLGGRDSMSYIEVELLEAYDRACAALQEGKR